MLHTMKLNSEPFMNIKSGAKTIELRLNDEKRQKSKGRGFHRIFAHRRPYTEAHNKSNGALSCADI